MAITSVLDDAIKSLPDNWKQKAQSIPNTLKRKGVKDEELKFAKIGLEEQIVKDPLKQLSKEDLLKGLEQRKDKQTVEVQKYDPLTRTGTDYGSITIGGAPTEGYQERVYQFGLGTIKTNTDKHHFPSVENKFAHVRVQPIDVNGKQTRSILELQSDEAIKSRAPVSGQEMKEISYLAERYKIVEANEEEEIADRLLELGWDGDTDLDDWVRSLTSPQSVPHEKNMMRKLLEKELVTAIDEGAEYTSIPIKGPALKDLHRDAKHIQPMYENQVASTARKVAKEQGLEVTYEKSGTKGLFFNQVELEMLASIYKTANDRVVEMEEGLVTSTPKALENAIAVRNKIVERLAGTTEGDGFYTANKVLSYMANGQTSVRGAKAILDNASKKSEEAEYLVIHHPKGTKVNTNLYEVGTGVAIATGLYSALDEGVTEEQAIGYLVSQQNYTEEEAKQELEQVKQAKEAGVSKEQLATYLESQEVVNVEHSDTVEEPIKAEEVFKPISASEAASMSHPSSPTGPSTNKAMSFEAFSGATETKAAEAIRTVDTVKDFVASQGVLNPSLHTTLDTVASFTYSDKAKRFVSQAEMFQRTRIQELAYKQHGWELMYDPAQGGWLVKHEGIWRAAEPSFLQELGKISGELTGFGAGSVAGYKVGQNIASKLGPLGKTGYAKAIPALSTAIGGIIGSVAGNETDYLIEAMNTHSELDAKVQLHRITDAAQMAAIGELLGPIVMKTPSAVLGAVSSVRSMPSRVKGAIESTQGIDEALAKTMFLNTAEADDLVKIMSRFSEVPGNTPTQKRVVASILTQPSGEGIVRDLGRLNKEASRGIAKTIDMRAQDLLTTASNLTDANLDRVLAQDLNNYVADTKKFYSDVKMTAAKAPKAQQWQFDMSKVAIDPILNTFKDNISTNVSDIGMRAKLMSRIKKIQNTTHTRNFNDLIELRQLVNDFKFNSNITKPQDFDAVNTVVKTIDNAITAGAKEVLPNADQWLTDFATAKFQYAQMKSVENNVMYKALTKPGIDYDKTVKTLTKYITAEDSTFTDVVAKLPKYTQAKVEGSVLRALSEKYTAGPEGGLRAVHFPQLAQALEGVSFTSKEARKFKLATKELAEVFRNDVPLSKVVGSLAPPGDAATIATSITGVAKRAIVAKVWNTALRMTESGTDKMVRLAAEVLDNPLNTKKMQELMEELEGQVDISEEARMLVNHAAQEQAMKGEIGMPKILLYGDGNTLSLKGTGEPTKIAIHRIASIEDAMKIAEAEGIARSDTKLLDAALHARGYKAVQYGADKVRVLK